MLKNINFIEFIICVVGNGSRYTTIACSPSKYSCLASMFDLYKGKERIQFLINKIKDISLNFDLRENPGENSYSLKVNGDITTFEFHGAGQNDLVELRTSIVIEVYEEYLKWYDRYENCELPGVIPKSKLDTWSCVPNEYIKDEYWEMLKKNKP